MSDSPVDTSRCPLCGGDNSCGARAGAPSCWCVEASIPPDVLDRVPVELRGVACICQACATGQARSDERETPDGQPPL